MLMQTCCLSKIDYIILYSKIEKLKLICFAVEEKIYEGKMTIAVCKVCCSDIVLIEIVLLHIFCLQFAYFILLILFVVTQMWDHFYFVLYE